MSSTTFNIDKSPLPTKETGLGNLSHPELIKPTDANSNLTNLSSLSSLHYGQAQEKRSNSGQVCSPSQPFNGYSQSSRRNADSNHSSQDPTLPSYSTATSRYPNRNTELGHLPDPDLIPPPPPPPRPPPPPQNTHQIHQQLNPQCEQHRDTKLLGYLPNPKTRPQSVGLQEVTKIQSVSPQVSQASHSTTDLCLLPNPIWTQPPKNLPSQLSPTSHFAAAQTYRSNTYDTGVAQKGDQTYHHTTVPKLAKRPFSCTGTGNTCITYTSLKPCDNPQEITDLINQLKSKSQSDSSENGPIPSTATDQGRRLQGVGTMRDKRPVNQVELRHSGGAFVSYSSENRGLQSIRYQSTPEHVNKPAVEPRDLAVKYLNQQEEIETLRGEVLNKDNKIQCLEERLRRFKTLGECSLTCGDTWTSPTLFQL